MQFLKFFPALLVFALISCATSSQKSGKPYDFCLCGPTINAEAEPLCAIWGENSNPSEGTRVWASERRPTCKPADCGQLFSGLCEKIQMSGISLPTPPAATEACYCDAILMENDKGQVQHYCAAWAEGGKNLLEYYALDECTPQHCGQAPFVLAPKLCKNGFKPFYSPLMNKR
ncbi:hypothetical protein [Oligoflexus tunisiensis]|uniref:hypothetical protein n=1 Tax=Oligoflexus tunisiensis TaxID=708132 RepID=UPI00114CECDE|nr:hypothetical protein [Oligoflexus tunisiensis]